MKKRSNAIVILSSDDDEDDETNNNVKNTRSLRSNSKSNRCNSIPKSSNSKPKPKTSTAKSTNKKKPRISQSLSSSVELFSTFDDLKFLSEDFAHGFAGFKVSTGCKKADGAESWVDKYRPRSVDELAVHKKKVEEVKVWLEGRLNNSKECQNYALLITGQAGIGKSATIRAVASHVGAEICEWNTPTPTLWQEHVHNSNAGSNESPVLATVAHYNPRPLNLQITDQQTEAQPNQHYQSSQNQKVPLQWLSVSYYVTWFCAKGFGCVMEEANFAGGDTV